MTPMILMKRSMVSLGASAETSSTVARKPSDGIDTMVPMTNAMPMTSATITPPRRLMPAMRSRPSGSERTMSQMRLYWTPAPSFW